MPCSGSYMAVGDLCQARQVRDDERGVGDGLHIQRLRKGLGLGDP